VDKVVSALDMFPTVCDLLGIPRKPGLDGESLIRVLSNPAGPPRSRPMLTCHEPGTFAVRTDKWTLIKWRDGVKEL
jgi:arylsulfatase A-like enzyme